VKYPFLEIIVLSGNQISQTGLLDTGDIIVNNMSVKKQPEKPDFLYFGDSKRRVMLLPSQKYCRSEKQGSQDAIYAYSNRNIALAYALGAVPDENGRLDRIMDYKYGGEVAMLFLKGHPAFGGKGYVYKLAVKGFIFTGGTQWVNFSPVTPLEITEIDVDNYLYLFRYATEEEKKQIEENFSER
jgi:hypothetical protein